MCTNSSSARAPPSNPARSCSLLREGGLKPYTMKFGSSTKAPGLRTQGCGRKSRKRTGKMSSLMRISRPRSKRMFSVSFLPSVSTWNSRFLGRYRTSQMCRCKHNVFCSQRGIVFYGPPGNGKTISIKAIMMGALDKGYSPLYVRSFKSNGYPHYTSHSFRLLIPNGQQVGRERSTP